MNPYVHMFFTILASVLASGGFWTLIQRRYDKNDAKTKLLVGLAHDRIVELGMTYIERGYIYQDEFENLDDYLFAPYEKAGGNGSAKRVMDVVRTLPIKPNPGK